MNKNKADAFAINFKKEHKTKKKLTRPSVYKLYDKAKYKEEPFFHLPFQS